MSLWHLCINDTYNIIDMKSSIHMYVVKVDEEDIDSLTAELISLRWVEHCWTFMHGSECTIRKRVQEYTDTHTRRSYQGEWAISTYEPYQMEALSIVSLKSPCYFIIVSICMCLKLLKVKFLWFNNIYVKLFI